MEGPQTVIAPNESFSRPVLFARANNSAQNDRVKQEFLLDLLSLVVRTEYCPFSLPYSTLRLAVGLSLKSISHVVDLHSFYFSSSALIFQRLLVYKVRA